MTTALRSDARSPLARWATAPGRIVACAILVAGVATLPRFTTPSAFVCASTVAVVLAVARPRWRTLLTRAAAALLVIAALVVPFVLGGRLLEAARLAGRASFAVAIALGITSTLTVAELPAALRALGVPAVLASMVRMILLQLGSLRDEGRRLALARRLRGTGGPALGARTVSILLVRAAERAERIELATRLRGAALSVDSGRLRASDAAVLVVSSALAALPHWLAAR